MLRRLLECCNLPQDIVDRLAPYTFDHAKQALLKNDTELLAKIIRSGLNLKQQDQNLLLLAMNQAKQDTILTLLKDHGQQFEYQSRNDKGDTALMVAIFRKMHKTVKVLVDRCDPNASDFRKNTPFMAAAANGDLQSLKILHQSNKCNTAAKNVYGQTALHRACYFGQMLAVEWLLENTELKVLDKDRRGNNGLHVACEGLNVALTRYLMMKVKNSGSLLVENNDQRRPLEVLMATIESVAPQFRETLDVEHLKLPQDKAMSKRSIMSRMSSKRDDLSSTYR